MEGNVYTIDFQSQYYGIPSRPVIYFKGCNLNCIWCNVQELKQTENYNVLLQNARDYKTKSEDIVKLISNYIPSDTRRYIGVVLAGGEVLLQPQFAIEIIQEFNRKGFPVYVETTGNIDEKIFQKVCRMADGLYWDLKHYDRKKHMEITGVDNQIIVKNFTWAVSHKHSVVAKIQVIKNVNDSLKDADAFLRFLNNIGINAVVLCGEFSQKYYEKFQNCGILWETTRVDT